MCRSRRAAAASDRSSRAKQRVRPDKPNPEALVLARASDAAGKVALLIVGELTSPVAISASLVTESLQRAACLRRIEAVSGLTFLRGALTARRVVLGTGRRCNVLLRDLLRWIDERLPDDDGGRTSVLAVPQRCGETEVSEPALGGQCSGRDGRRPAHGVSFGYFWLAVSGPSADIRRERSSANEGFHTSVRRPNIATLEDTPRSTLGDQVADTLTEPFHLLPEGERRPRRGPRDAGSPAITVAGRADAPRQDPLSRFQQQATGWAGSTTVCGRAAQTSESGLLDSGDGGCEGQRASCADS